MKLFKRSSLFAFFICICLTATGCGTGKGPKSSAGNSGASLSASGTESAATDVSAGNTDGSQTDSSNNSASGGQTGKNSKSTATSSKKDTEKTPSATEYVKNPFNGKSGRPNFTEKEIEQQKEAGKSLLLELREAARDLSKKSYTIQPGHYGFALDTKIAQMNSGFYLLDINRPDNNPFTIIAKNVTFWIDGFSGRPVHLSNCSNLVIDGLTIDSYIPNTIEGTITNIDTAGNRVGIRLNEGVMAVTADNVNDIFKSAFEKRVVPVKANGESVSALYSVGNFHLSKMEVSGSTVWFTFAQRNVVQLSENSAWKSVYGKQGIMEVGDSLSMIYGTQMAIALDNCKKITIKNTNVYIAKGSWWENGGYGDHLWQNCYFGPRPDTNRVWGGEGNMSQGLRHGSTYDNITINVASDDAINIHGFWSKVVSVDGNKARFEAASAGIQKGDTAEFRDQQGKLVTTRTVAETPSNMYNYNGWLTGSITLNSAPPSNYKDLIVRWPGSECDGWVIKNCTFKNVYQRILINSGSGVFENNIVYNLGSNLSFASNNAALEGGVMHDITVRNNVFYTTSWHPYNAWYGGVVQFTQTINMRTNISATNLNVHDNVFVNCGSFLSADNTKNLKAGNNTIINPYVVSENTYVRKSVTSFADLYKSTYSSGDVVQGNTAYILGGSAAGGNNPLAPLSESKLQAIDKHCRNLNLSAKEMASKILAELK